MTEPEIYESYGYAVPEEFQPEDLDARVIVHFRPSSDWKGMSYGFDWMRCGDYKEVLAKAGQDTVYAGGDTPYEEIVGYNYDPLKPNNLLWNANEYRTIFKKAPELYEKLKQEYKPSNISKSPIEGRDKRGERKFELYYCSWLSLYPGKEAILSLIIEVDCEEDIPDGLALEYDDTFLEVGWTNGEPVLNVGKNILPDVLSVKCLKEFGNDLPVTIHSVTKNPRGELLKKAGQMWLWANKIGGNLTAMKRTTTLFVNVNTRKKTENKTQELKIKKIIEENKPYFRQALIEMDGVFMNLSVYDDPHFQPGGHYYYERGLVMTYMPYSEFVKGQRTPSITYPGMPVGFVNLDEYLVSKLEALPELNIPDKSISDCIVVFFLDKPPVSKAVDKITDKALYQTVQGGHINGTLNILISPVALKTTTITHEIGHALNLEHPFANRIVSGPNIMQEYAKYTFRPMTTHNIMDYSDLRGISPNVIPLYYFWKWQWEYMNKKIIRNGKVKPSAKSKK